MGGGLDRIARVSGRQRIVPGRRGVLAGLFSLAFLLPPSGLSGQTTTAAPDTYADVNARALMARARAARERAVLDIGSYEGVLRERIYVGLSSFRFRRERGLFDQERVARIRWSDDGERAIQWIGARRAVPIVGADSREAARARERRGALAGQLAESDREVGEALANDLPDELLGAMDLPAFAFEPNADRLALGADWALNPLADSAVAHYRYTTGDTLTLTLPERRLVLVEIRVEPRRADFELVAASLWFDAETASLVRATYKPARPYDMALDDPDDADDLPPFVGSVEAEIDYITVEYSFHEQRYWLPRRFAFEGEAQLGVLARIPVTIEWIVGDYTVNEPTSTIPLTGPLPSGWFRRVERVERSGEEPHYMTVVVPVADSILTSPSLSDDVSGRTPSTFTDDELDELRGELGALLPTDRRFRPSVSVATPRYNRVEGLGLGVASSLALSPELDLEAEIRAGSETLDDPEFAGGLRLGSEDRGWSVGYVHDRLESMNELENFFGIANTAKSLFLGGDRGQYYRRTGGSLGVYGAGHATRWEMVAFRERHEAVGLGTDFFLGDVVLDRVPEPLIPADEIRVWGTRAALRWFAGQDPGELILSGTLRGEVGFGDARYQRLLGTLAGSHPLPFGLAGAMEVLGGVAWAGNGEDVPAQRRWFLGGPRSMRGFHENEIRTDDFVVTRMEVGSGFAGTRLAVFGDLAWTGLGATDASSLDAASMGVGGSLLDGLVRVDVARAVVGASRWKLHMYFDGLF